MMERVSSGSYGVGIANARKGRTSPMRRRMNNPRDLDHGRAEDKLVFRLYVTDQAPSSVRAMANIRTICQEYLNDNYALEIVDATKEPLRAMEDGIILTPTLVKLSPEPRWTIVGDLSEDTRVLASMHADGHHLTEPAVHKPHGGKNADRKPGVGTSSSRTHRSSGSRV